MAPPGAKTIATTLLAGADPLTVSCPGVSLLMILLYDGVFFRKPADTAYQRLSPLASRKSSAPIVRHGKRPIRLTAAMPLLSLSGQGSAPGWNGVAPPVCHCSLAAYAMSAVLAFLSALMLRSSRSLEIPALVKLSVLAIRKALIKAARARSAISAKPR